MGPGSLETDAPVALYGRRRSVSFRSVPFSRTSERVMMAHSHSRGWIVSLFAVGCVSIFLMTQLTLGFRSVPQVRVGGFPGQQCEEVSDSQNIQELFSLGFPHRMREIKWAWLRRRLTRHISWFLFYVSFMNHMKIGTQSRQFSKKRYIKVVMVSARTLQEAGK